MNNLNNQLQELSILYEINQKLDENMDLNVVLGPVLEILAKHLGMERGTLTILNKETKEGVIEEAYGLTDEQRTRGRYKLGEGITGKVIETGESIYVPVISHENTFLDKTKARSSLNKQELSFICVPIKIGKEVIGALSFDKKYTEKSPIEKDLHLITLIASQIAQAVKLRQSVQEEIEALKFENNELHDKLKTKFNPSNIIGDSKPIREVYKLIEKVYDSKTTVLIRGESGVGKELVAQAIHYNGVRANNPFIKVNCAALPDNLIESELFGHEKGAFTGAITQRKGRFELAHNGTIFLDEIGDIPLSTQIKLLRILQERELERLGSITPIKVDVRVICATNQPLEKMIDEGTFRQDLYYRINVFPIFVPSLRERKEDILILANYFVDKYSKINGKDIKRISGAAIDILLSYDWPGNVRELENCIERSVILSNDGVIHGYNLPHTMQTPEMTGTESIGSLESVLNNVEKDMIIESLKISRGNMSKTAKILGLTERMMGIRIKKHNIDCKKYKT